METIAILIFFGAVLLVLETILPGMVAGLLGALCLLAAVVTGYTRLPAGQAHLVLLFVCLGVLLGVWLWFKYFPDSALARRFISQRSIGEIGAEQPALLNHAGVAHSNLRPSGTALIDGKRVDVVSEGAMIERGAAIKVVAVEGARVVVRAV